MGMMIEKYTIEDEIDARTSEIENGIGLLERQR